MPALSCSGSVPLLPYLYCRVNESLSLSCLRTITCLESVWHAGKCSVGLVTMSNYAFYDFAGLFSADFTLPSRKLHKKVLASVPSPQPGG